MSRLVSEVRAVLEGGAVMVQFRDKTPDTDWKKEAAVRLRELCSGYSVPLIINDDAKLAQDCGADGVHLGRDESDPGLVTAWSDRGLLVGVSCYNDLQRGRAAVSQGASYLAFGSVYVSATKPSAVRCPLETISQASGLGLPLVAIGGISPENGAPVIRAGARLLAVISGVFETPDVRAAARRYSDLWP